MWILSKFLHLYDICFKCDNNKRLEHDWLLTALIYGLIGQTDLSDYKHL